MRDVTFMVLGSNENWLEISILDYEESAAGNRDDRNALLVSIELKHDGKASIVTAPVISTHELSALADWFEQTASGSNPDTVVLLEPCLFFRCPNAQNERYCVEVRMEAEASPIWNRYYAEPFSMTFWLSHEQMVEAARSLRRLHLDYPTQS